MAIVSVAVEALRKFARMCQSGVLSGSRASRDLRLVEGFVLVVWTPFGCT